LLDSSTCPTCEVSLNRYLIHHEKTGIILVLLILGCNVSLYINKKLEEKMLRFRLTKVISLNKNRACVECWGVVEFIQDLNV
ncbi:hypothetical protein HZS_2264, partial [Henneguya salminicola]